MKTQLDYQRASDLYDACESTIEQIVNFYGAYVYDKPHDSPSKAYRHLNKLKKELWTDMLDYQKSQYNRLKDVPQNILK